MAGYDVIGNIAIVKFERSLSQKRKKDFGLRFLRENKNVTTVLEKSGKISGRLRTPTTKFVAGDKTKEAIYRENGCEFRLNVDSCYFSPRLSSERKEIASFVKRGERVLVMFGGVAPFAIVIAKHSGAKEVVSVELGREPSRYAVENIKRNKLIGRVISVQGDVKRVASKLGKFDRVVMARPNLRESFLSAGFESVKNNGTIHYYGFYEEDKVDELKELILLEAKSAKRKVKILRVKKIGSGIGIRKFRYRVDLRVS